MTETPEKTESPSATAAGPAASKQADSSREQIKGAAVNFTIETLNAHGSVFGATERPPARLRADTGRLDDPEIAKELRVFVPPTSFDDALASLSSDHAVVLQGDAGTGKRLSAIALLREVTDGPLAQLSPIITLKQLAEREYAKNNGYIVVDRKTEDRAADTDFTWRTVRDRVRDHGAFLVVTATCKADKAAAEAVAHIDWQQPEFRDVLRAHLDTMADPETVIAELVEMWPGCRKLADVAAVAKGIADGKDLTAALDLLDTTSSQEVHQWFNEPRSRQEVLSVTALAFLAGVSQRTFESLLAALASKADEFIPVDSGPEDRPTPTDLMPQNRRQLYPEDGLVKVVRADAQGVARHQVHFAEGRYRQHVLAELWQRMDAPFWDAVRAWLPDVIEEHGLEVASGLTELARTAFDEVDDLIWPWSDGELGWPGQITAIYVLWLMSFDDTLAPEALQRATMWANSTPARRWTAAVSFSQVLGVRYPHEAAKRLWQLIRQSDAVAGDAYYALAALFCTLTEETDDAGIVLVLLDGQLNKTRPKPWLRKVTMTATVMVLLATERTGRSAVIRYLHDRPEKAGVLGRLWAAVIRNRPTRKNALIALRDGLKDLRDISDDPGSLARTLGEALASSLPADEHEPLRRDLASLEARNRKDTSPLIEQLLDAITQITQEKETG
ncbi:hypothetical protein KIPE111705_16850 [Kibdelosporangium persicum]|uniref:Uncharacterized protein n=1 Tax=Kibdelosporangium persicum TaxID=2698649 RepID=A0ABX2EYH9_9PSEU|nr:hypothetical protein [Kibdelosporangium persicum]NRN64047.1 hypothetical protein [Kibdelosporangium persicum]